MGTSTKKHNQSNRRGLGSQPRRNPFSSSSSAKKSSPINPFDAVGNRKAKFEVLNKRAKGQVRNVGKARQLAVERRKKTLLVEYHASKKDNVFKDRRFGEDDPSLSLEEKMLLRFQKERQKRERKSGGRRFNLEEGDDDDDDDEYGGLLLTHKGKALGADDYQDQDGLASSDDEDGPKGLNREIVKSMHFGGGVGAAGSRKRALEGGDDGDGEDDGGLMRKKTRAELMEEIIAKSKFHKAAKAKQKDAQEMALSRLDEGFQDMVGDLEFRDKYASKKQEKERDAREKEERETARRLGVGEKKGPLLDEDEDYDEMMAAIRDERFAAKARDRTKTPEEIANEEKAKLEQLEAARLARMRGEVDEELKKEARGGKSRGGGGDDNDDDDDDDEGDSSEEEGGGDGLGELGKDWDASSSSESESESDNDSSSSSDDDSSSSSSVDGQHAEESGSSDEEEEDGEEDSDDEDSDDGIPPALLQKMLKAKEKQKKEKTSRKKGAAAEDDEEEEEAEEGRPIGKAARQKAAVAKTVAQTQKGHTGINPDMPYLLDCPTTMERFVELVQEYAKGPQDVAEMITRIRRYHSIRSGGSREKVHNFYDVLMRRLARLGEALQQHQHKQDDEEDEEDTANSTGQARAMEINALAEALAAMSADMPDVAAGLWGRMLTGLQAKLGKALRDHELGQRARSTWPSLGSLLLLRLLPRIFPVTDFRHPVVTPALLSLGQALSQCPVLTTVDMERGLFVAALAVQYTEGAGRLMPEAMAFLLSVFWALGGAEEGKPLPLPTFASTMTAALRENLVLFIQKQGGKDEETTMKALMEVPMVLGAAAAESKAAAAAEDDEERDEGESSKRGKEVTPFLAGKYLMTVCRLLQRLAGGQLQKSPAAPEIFGPFVEALAMLQTSLLASSTSSTTKAENKKSSSKKGAKKKTDTESESGTSHPLLEMVQATKATLVTLVAGANKSRSVLSWRKKGITTVQSLAPRLIDNFVVRKDEGLEREAAKMKQLSRQVKREKKGAMRELRRDAAFLDAEKVRGQQEAEAERKRVVKENTAWFETAAADFNKQVKMSKGDKVRGGGSGLKTAVMKR